MFFLGEKKVFLSSIFFGDENKEEPMRWLFDDLI